ncbi:MAG: hypothetical protein NTW30_05500 [Candidatus Aenigmarchaeota archaeon]|nr:hypothetical protein [Candidatus Aenigmarchaeota archaeon]
MKVTNLTKFMLVTIFTLFMVSTAVTSIGVTQPIPVGLKILRGTTAKFYFQIQALKDSKQSCTYSATGLDPLVITLDENKATVDEGTIKNVYGTVSVPNDAPIKTYTGMVIVSCAPFTGANEDFSGSVVKQTTGANFIINVVEHLEEQPVIPIPEKEKPKASPIILVLIIIVLILAIVGFYFSRKKKIE